MSGKVQEIWFFFQCEDPSSKCQKNDWHVGSAAQQVSRRGPIFVEDRRLPVEYERGHEARTQQKVIEHKYVSGREIPITPL